MPGMVKVKRAEKVRFVASGELVCHVHVKPQAIWHKRAPVGIVVVHRTGTFPTRKLQFALFL
jgi:hypothetical protein